MKKIALHWIILFLAACLFIPFLGSIHLFDWDEANFAELAREMIVSGDYLRPQINFLPFYEKPPLFIWMQVLSMKVFGINEFAARFPNAIAGIIVLLSLYHIGKKHFSEAMGVCWVVSFGASIAPHFYFRTGLIDPIFNFFIFLAIYYFSFLFQKNHWKQSAVYCILSGLFASAAVMTKGPVALILICASLGLGWILLRFRAWKHMSYLPLWLAVTIGLSSIWFMYITSEYGSTYVDEFINYQIRLFETEDAKHGGTIFFHPVALILGCFPASIYMWTAFRKNIVVHENEFQQILRQVMIACGLVVLIVFTVVKTKIIHYSSMDYYPISFFSALAMTAIIERKIGLFTWQKILLLGIGILWALALILVPIAGNNLDKIRPFIHDSNFLEQLKAPIEWHYWASLLGLIFGGLFIMGVRRMQTKIRQGFFYLALSIIFLIQVVSYYYLPRIEEMVQGSLVEFAKSKSSEDCYFSTFYMKSYGNLFYGKVKQHAVDTAKSNHHWWIYGNNDKRIYYSVLASDTAKVNQYHIPGLDYLGNQNGIHFYKREASILYK